MESSDAESHLQTPTPSNVATYGGGSTASPSPSMTSGSDGTVGQAASPFQPDVGSGQVLQESPFLSFSAAQPVVLPQVQLVGSYVPAVAPSVSPALPPISTCQYRGSQPTPVTVATDSRATESRASQVSLTAETRLGMMSCVVSLCVQKSPSCNIFSVGST